MEVTSLGVTSTCWGMWIGGEKSLPSSPLPWHSAFHVGLSECLVSLLAHFCWSSSYSSCVFYFFTSVSWNFSVNQIREMGCLLWETDKNNCYTINLKSISLIVFFITKFWEPLICKWNVCFWFFKKYCKVQWDSPAGTCLGVILENLNLNTEFHRKIKKENLFHKVF